MKAIIRGIQVEGTVDEVIEYQQKLGDVDVRVHFVQSTMGAAEDLLSGIRKSMMHQGVRV